MCIIILKMRFKINQNIPEVGAVPAVGELKALLQAGTSPYWWL